jgi:hypothetical protein
MPRKKTKEVSATPKIEAVAKATAEAKATYSRSHKRTVTEVIPEDVTRAKAGAWLTLISPLTEWAGLKGDALRHKRELLRIQQEETLGQIALRARQRLSKQIETLSSIPLKFMVPFLEQASLEDPDSILVDLWANLLVSASEEFSDRHIHFVSIISRMSASQGAVLKKLVGTQSLDELATTMKERWLFEPLYVVEANLRNSLEVAARHKVQDELIGYEDILDPIDGQLILRVIKAFFDRKGVWVIFVSCYNKSLLLDVPTVHRVYEDSEEEEVDHPILEALGLVRRVDVNFNVRMWSVRVVYYHLTGLGYQFAKACRIVT